MRQNVLIWGASGNVGRALIDQIAEKDQTTHRNPTDIIGIADSEHAIVSDKALDQRVLREVARTRDGIKGYLAANKAKYSDPRELVDMVRKVGRDGEVIVVDVTTVGESAKDFHLDVLDRSSNKVATANKNPVSLYSMADFNGLTRHHGRYNYDATVMAGKGAIDFAIRSRELNDSVNEIEGMLHGPESPFYAMNGTYNKVVFKTDILRNGHIIESPGAGLDVTAASVRDAIRRMMPADALRM